VARPLAAAILAYALVFSAWSLALHARLDTGIFDLGIHTQAMWLISQGLPEFLSTRGLTMLGDHFTPILYLLSPLHRPEAILVFQSLLIASGAYPMVRLAQHDLNRPGPALGFGLAYLLQPGLWSANLFDFHASALATPLLLWALWGLHSRAYGLYFICLLLTLGLGEALGITVALVGVEAWRLGRPRLALATLLLGLAGSVLALAVMTRANHGQASQYQSLYCSLQFHPLQWLTYGALLLLPLGGLPLAGWPRLIPALPVILGNLLSWREGQRGLDHHYLATILPFLLWAAVAGWRRWKPGWPPLVGLALLSLGLHASQLQRACQPRPDLSALSNLPSNASVSADNAPGAHLSLRQHLYLFPNPFQPLCWGNRAGALVETVGQAGHPPMPGQLQRRLRQCAVDYLVFSPLADTWPLRPQDKAYWIHEIRRSGLYQERSGGIWQRRQPGQLKPPVAELQPRLSSNGQQWVYADERGVVLANATTERVLAPGWQADISADGTQVTFVSESDRLMLGDHNASADCFVWRDESLRRLAPNLPVGQATAHWPRFFAEQVIALGYGIQRRPQPGPGDGLWLGPVEQDWGTILDAEGRVFCCNRRTGRQFPGCTPVVGGERLVYAREVGGRYQLFQEERPLTQSPLDCLEPDLSADGRWLVYTCGDEIVRQNLSDGSEQILGRGNHPCISGDGSTVMWAQGDRLRRWQP
jgi:hypothetical protein